MSSKHKRHKSTASRRTSLPVAVYMDPFLEQSADDTKSNASTTPRTPRQRTAHPLTRQATRTRMMPSFMKPASYAPPGLNSDTGLRRRTPPHTVSSSAANPVDPEEVKKQQVAIKKLDLSRRNLRRLFRKYDKNHDGGLQFREFTSCMAALNFNTDNMAILRNVFHAMDKTHSGNITEDEFVLAFKQINEQKLSEILNQEARALEEDPSINISVVEYGLMEDQWRQYDVAPHQLAKYVELARVTRRYTFAVRELANTRSLVSARRQEQGSGRLQQPSLMRVQSEPLGRARFGHRRAATMHTQSSAQSSRAPPQSAVHSEPVGNAVAGRIPILHQGVHGRSHGRMPSLSSQGSLHRPVTVVERPEEEAEEEEDVSEVRNHEPSASNHARGGSGVVVTDVTGHDVPLRSRSGASGKGDQSKEQEDEKKQQHSKRPSASDSSATEPATDKDSVRMPASERTSQFSQFSVIGDNDQSPEERRLSGECERLWQQIEELEELLEIPVGMRTEAAHNEDMEETDIAVGWDVHWIDITGYSEAIMEVISNEYNLPRTAIEDVGVAQRAKVEHLTDGDSSGALTGGTRGVPRDVSVNYQQDSQHLRERLRRLDHITVADTVGYSEPTPRRLEATSREVLVASGGLKDHKSLDDVPTTDNTIGDDDERASTPSVLSVHSSVEPLQDFGSPLDCEHDTKLQVIAHLLSFQNIPIREKKTDPNDFTLVQKFREPVLLSDQVVIFVVGDHTLVTFRASSMLADVVASSLHSGQDRREATFADELKRLHEYHERLPPKSAMSSEDMSSPNHKSPQRNSPTTRADDNKSLGVSATNIKERAISVVDRLRGARHSSQRDLVQDLQQGNSLPFANIWDSLRSELRDIFPSDMRHKGAKFLSYRVLDEIVEFNWQIRDIMQDWYETLEEEIREDPRNYHVNHIFDMQKSVAIASNGLDSSLYDDLVFKHGAPADVRKAPNVLTDELDYFRDLQTSASQLKDNVSLLRDRLKQLLEMYQTQNNDKMNRVLYILTVVTTIFVPGQFFTGLYGMNFEVMPELTWKWSYLLFWIIVALISAVIVLWFRRRNYFTI